MNNTKIRIKDKKVPVAAGSWGVILCVGKVFACTIPGKAGVTDKEFEASIFVDVAALRRHWHKYMPLIVHAAKYEATKPTSPLPCRGEIRTLDGKTLYKCVASGTKDDGSVWDRMEGSNLVREANYTLCCQLDKFGKTVTEAEVQP